MVMSHTSKGFLLLDSLINVFIVSCLVTLCYTTYNLMVKYEQGYRQYESNETDRYERIFNELDECEVCEVDEPDEESIGLDD